MNEPTKAPPDLEDPGQKFRDELDVRFNWHPWKKHQITRQGQLGALGKDLALKIADLTPPSRERSLALTHLEQALMYAYEAMLRRE